MYPNLLLRTRTSEECRTSGSEDRASEDEWEEAFEDQEAKEDGSTEEKSDEETKNEEVEDEEQDIAAAELEDSEDDYPDDDGDSKEDKRIKIGPISVPATKTGKMMLAGGVLGILLTAGGIYFAIQTFAPPELAEVEKTKTEVPEGLTPKKEESDKLKSDVCFGELHFYLHNRHLVWLLCR